MAQVKSKAKAKGTGRRPEPQGRTAAKAARSEKGKGAPHSEKGEEPGGGAQGELFDANDVQARIDKTIQVLGRQGIMQALEDMGITYQANASNKHLAKLLLTSQGEIKAEE